MKDLLIILADVMPVDMIINQIKKDLAKYEEDPNEDNLKGFEVACMLLLSKRATSAAGGIDKMTKDIKDLEMMSAALKPKGN